MNKVIEDTDLPNPDLFELSLMNSHSLGYHFDEVLGSGQCGDVFKVSKEGKSYAVKAIWNKTQSFEVKPFPDLENMIKDYLSVSSPFLVKYVEVLKDSDLLLVMELCGCNLEQFVKRREGSPITEKVLMKIVVQMLLGLYELHKGKKIHGNIKLQNVFIDDNYNTKLGDFGMWDLIEMRFYDYFIDDPVYFAPEVFRTDYSCSADVWSMGVLLYYLCTKMFPFNGDFISLPDIIAKNQYPKIPSGKYTDDMCNMIYSMLSVDSSMRPTVRDLLKSAHVMKYVNESEMKGIFDHYFPGVLSSFTLKTSSSMPPSSVSSTPSEVLQSSPLGTFASGGS